MDTRPDEGTGFDVDAPPLLAELDPAPPEGIGFNPEEELGIPTLEPATELDPA